MEIELKTIFTECELNKFLQSKFFTKLVEKGSEQVLQLTSVYYDTPDFALQKQGSVYRVRTTQFADGKKEFESTTKRTVKKNGGVAEREEINEPQENALPKLPDVQEIFRTEVIRKIYYLEHGQALFEMAIDRGKIVVVNENENDNWLRLVNENENDNWLRLEGLDNKENKVFSDGLPSIVIVFVIVIVKKELSFSLSLS